MKNLVWPLHQLHAHAIKTRARASSHERRLSSIHVAAARMASAQPSATGPQATAFPHKIHGMALTHVIANKAEAAISTAI